MEIHKANITLHADAEAFLFQHYRTLRRIFNDVLGQLEIDYIGIALLNPHNELFFLSSKPAIEHNLIEHGLWAIDPSFKPNYFLDNQARPWGEMVQVKSNERLRHYKLDNPKFSFGVSVPSSFNEYRVTYSFALRTEDTAIQQNLMEKIDVLASMGRFCLQQISKAIVLPDRQQVLTPKKPSLKLIINNKVLHENIT